ncbi:MAG TPA: MbcA/ParS/Xre antitoxin family protein [Rhodanobacter sp.]|nr:MbcA/ParS/Xre antitoxin family protein [Rhodanobacter sp.]
MTAQPTRVAEAMPRYSPPADALAAPALRTFFRLAEHWKLRIAEQRKLLGDPPESTFYKWKREQDGSLGRDTLERVSYLLGIWQALQILFPDPAQADAWLQKPNAAPLFGGQSALERMLSGNVADLYVVRQYLDAQRG